MLGRRNRFAGWQAPAYVVAAVLVLVVVPGRSCSSEAVRTASDPDPDTNPIGLLAVFGAAAYAGVGVGALSRRAWKAGALAVAVGVAGALLALFVLAAKDCGLDSG